MDVYYIKYGGRWNMYCQNCADHFLQQGGDANNIDGPHPNGGGKANLILHCDQGVCCKNPTHTRAGPRGACFHNDLTPTGIKYTIVVLEDYVNNKRGIPEVLDLWAKEVHNYLLSTVDADFIRKYNEIRATEKSNFNAIVNKGLDIKSKKKQDNTVSGLVAFFDDRPVVGKVRCKSCRDTGVVVLFNSSVKCTDCIRSEP